MNIVVYSPIITNYHGKHLWVGWYQMLILITSRGGGGKDLKLSNPGTFIACQFVFCMMWS